MQAEQATKDRPILFSAPMVRALLDGTKTQTRRIVKPQPTEADWDKARANLGGDTHRAYVVVHPGFGIGLRGDDRATAGIGFPEPNITCQHGARGDRLWVKESYWGCDMPGLGDTPCVVYDEEHHGKDYTPAEPRPWALKFGRIPSIHCSREASRITLEITEVRVQRLQAISEADAVAEGVGYWGCDTVQHYADLWDSINGAGAWDANPWVWAISFRRVTP